MRKKFSDCAPNKRLDIKQVSKELPEIKKDDDDKLVKDYQISKFEQLKDEFQLVIGHSDDTLQDRDIFKSFFAKDRNKRPDVTQVYEQLNKSKSSDSTKEDIDVD